MDGNDFSKSTPFVLYLKPFESEVDKNKISYSVWMEHQNQMKCHIFEAGIWGAIRRAGLINTVYYRLTNALENSLQNLQVF